ncbi:Vsp/OspC family lipoprotein [Borrelia puertoricensis]|uniref:Vsp/OspC family lipoprotein n=1 Tax=Borrelia puertoricensis TaxID=2756107 RepID=UPI0032215634
MKRITLCALLMTLFLLSSCNTSGAATKDGQAARSDGTIIDLVTITNNITDAVAFAKGVTEIHTLVKSIDALAKAIGKKIDANGLTTENAHNGSLIAGAYSVIEAVDTKLGTLAGKVGLSSDLKAKITVAKTASTAFLTTVKGANADLGKENASDDDTKKALVTNNADKSKGAKELGELNTAIDALLKDANDAVTAAINALTTSAKP